ncbi:tRNA lysidine(34) synthetase TilS [Myxococcota bacterium]|nr:tRNA lysidine(34) synthetase TilS [Myxococcota bacterium]
MTGAPERPRPHSSLPRAAEGLRARVVAAIRREPLIADGAVVVVGVSGGLDSTVLLDLLWDLAPRHGWRLVVAHADHGLRARSGEDALAVGWLAAERRLPFVTRRLALDPSALAARGVEAAAREARYAFLERVRRRTGARRVAVGHHMADQAETAIMGLLRGGIAAMPPRRGRLVRPLLGEARGALRAWAAARGLRWREDPTNADPRHLRNRVRAEVLPLLATIDPGAVRGVAAAATRWGEDAAALDAVAASLVGEPGAPVALAAYASWPRAVRARVLVRLARGAGAPLGMRAAGDLDLRILAGGAGPRVFHLASGARLELLGQDLVCEAPAGVGRGARERRGIAPRVVDNSSD